MTSVDSPAPQAVRSTQPSARWRAVLLAAVAACAAGGLG
jgi:spermidine synthase